MRVLAMVLVVGCASGPDGSDRKGTRNGTPAGVVTSTGSTASTGEPSGTTGTPTGTLTTTDVYDCDTMPALPLGDTILDAPRGYNDLVFDLNGEMIGHNSAGDVFLRASDSQTAAVHAPESDTVYKMAMLASGDFVAATSNNGLIRVTPSGSVSTVLNTVRGYGLAVHTPTDMVYVATNYTSGVDGIIRVDPDTGDWEILESLGETPRAIAFSREHDVLYIGTTDGGRVLRLPLDANGDPTGPATLLTTVPGAWHDTVEVDGARVRVEPGTWFLVRASNTTPNLTVRLEGTSAEAVERARGLLLEALATQPSVETGPLRVG